MSHPTSDVPNSDVAVETSVDAQTRTEILVLDQAAADHDGVAPLDDQVRLDLAHASATARHLVLRSAGDLVAYAHLDQADALVGTGHLVVRPTWRRRGLGSRLLGVITAEHHGPLRLWAHGDLVEARGFASAHGLSRVRELWQMSGPLSAQIPSPTYAEGVALRTFEPGRDEDAWVAVNSAAFRHHPEQGSLTRADLEQRMAEPWFDPAGFFLAERDGELLGYHWTKVHPSMPGRAGPVGEVYVLGVAPAAQGLGLGTSLTATGLRHLHSQGLDTVLLYVEGDNEAAIAVYAKLGLRQVALDVMYEVAS